MKRRLYVWLGLLLVPILVATLAAGCAAPAANTGNVPQEGIKVHGHWTIDVLSPDGTLVAHREFENALTGEGATNLAALLAREISAGGWLIELYNTDNTLPPFLSEAV